MQTKNITQEVILSCSPKDAFKSWLDSKIHGEIIGGKAIIDPTIGGKFNLWDDYIIGKTIELDEKKLTIVQQWRDNSTNWPKNYYSKITITFHPYLKNQTKLVLVHDGIPENHVDSIAQGWKDYYWKPMKKYFTVHK